MAIEELDERYKFNAKNSSTASWNHSGKNDIIDKLNEVVGELNKAVETLKEMEPLLEYVRQKMNKDKAAELTEYFKQNK